MFWSEKQHVFIIRHKYWCINTHSHYTKHIFEAIITKLLFTKFRCILLLCMQAPIVWFQNKDVAALTSPYLYTVEASITFRYSFKSWMQSKNKLLNYYHQHHNYYINICHAQKFYVYLATIYIPFLAVTQDKTFWTFDFKIDSPVPSITLCQNHLKYN